ncbi:hypothetical protein [Roseimicrobium sp. ORNL1]|uniref:hypothetical protein n=1 Tax=Roseimicrobium sp. ORNL1 TaxID=2711231 RepID=UPI0013E0F279|nr:hypothetical protein [Roseimicrobium sp. ORNL1]QIF02621.1 hypothetical protein G5S37_14165 [Roseimicrobium sp. ORNL1]
MSWQEPWIPVRNESEWRLLQTELDRELSSGHPLWHTGATIFGRHQGSDDVLVFLRDGRFGVVHLMWHGKVEQRPDQLPWTVLYDDIDTLQKGLNEEFEAGT